MEFSKNQTGKRIYLSYDQRDKDQIITVQKALLDGGFQVYSDYSVIEPGENWSEALKYRLEASDFVLLFLSNQLFKRDNFVFEYTDDFLSDIKRRNINLIPIKMDDVRIPSNLKEFEYYDLSGSNRDVMGLIRRIEMVVFTAIHELGHVFNLWHIDNIRNFMATSPQQSSYGLDAYYFRPEHRVRLVNADNLHVRPGGSQFGDWGSGGPAVTNPFNSVTENTNLILEISTTRIEFWHFEPVELNISLSLKNKKGKKVKVPDHIDPGYERFGIYITRPDGTVFKYKPTKFFCRNTDEIEITPTSPFLRDVSIFGQSAGYTFTDAGVYSIQCYFKLNDGITLNSNKVEVEVKTPMIGNSNFEKLEKLLTSSFAGLLLYYRSGYYPISIIDALKSLSKKKGDKLSVDILYALTRFLTQSNESAKGKEKIIHRMLKEGLDSGFLSKNKEKNLVSVQQKIFHQE